MTVGEFQNKLNNEFGLTKWPKTYDVDHETYANVCQFIFDKVEYIDYGPTGNHEVVISLGKNNGILFKNVELILK